MAESQLANDELGSICPVQTIDAICPCNTILHLRFLVTSTIAVVEEARCSEDFFSNRLQGPNNILIPALVVRA